MSLVDLASNITHYRHTARALNGAGLLSRFVTGPSACENDRWMAGGPAILRRLWNERRLSGIDPARIRRLWTPELFQKLSGKLGGVNDDIANEIWSRLAVRNLSGAPVLHSVQSIGLRCALKVKRSGGLFVLDMREEHPLFQRDVLGTEAKTLGLDYVGATDEYVTNVMREIDAADYILCPSGYARDTILKYGTPPERVRVVPYGVDTADIAFQQPRGTKQQFNVLFFGTICMRKGVHYLLEAFRDAKLSDARLTLAGPVGNFEAVLGKHRDLFVATGPVKRRDVPSLLADADVVVLPSLADSYGLVVAEAMAAGRPVIVSENTGSKQLVVEGRNGFIVEARNSAQIAAHLTFLHGNRDRIATMGAAARQAVQAATWSDYERILLSFYEELCQRHGLTV